MLISNTKPSQHYVLELYIEGLKMHIHVMLVLGCVLVLGMHTFELGSRHDESTFLNNNNKST